MYYSLLAVAFGCKAFAFDANKEVLVYLNMSLALNGFSSSVRVFEGIVLDTLDVNFDGWNARPEGDPDASNVPSHVATQAVKLDEIVRQPVLYVKTANTRRASLRIGLAGIVMI
ncbi:hypothetical protein VOLCADRAFT_87399 [Volvox carteri f. nagariensis]|uniref:Uncharacterized protein n=1 Tax=Volvox carteri f. nagariensis TaxID=3068 RepID=D8TL90_VOLCA|nr:uncharacterized protein VOLCADRAFT_87399 [Volvox carteri f. nagariensis]EFJ51696.1 hypothetical protein VOLCADRAFT_87399 [Volvox carteri f. nagariensis]|eukprot:XP_002947106.1 hypothetical protein VOLCADRAFT_87399 [Volvox carteri f. nagariensis]